MAHHSRDNLEHRKTRSRCHHQGCQSDGSPSLNTGKERTHDSGLHRETEDTILGHDPSGCSSLRMSNIGVLGHREAWRAHSKEPFGFRSQSSRQEIQPRRKRGQEWSQDHHDTDPGDEIQPHPWRTHILGKAARQRRPGERLTTSPRSERSSKGIPPLQLREQRRKSSTLNQNNLPTSFNGCSQRREASSNARTFHSHRLDTRIPTPRPPIRRHESEGALEQRRVPPIPPRPRESPSPLHASRTT